MSDRTIYDDISPANAGAMVQRAGLVLLIERAIERLGLTSESAAERLGIEANQLSLVLGGRFRDVEPEILLLWLRKLGHDLRINIDTAPTSDSGVGEVVITPLPYQR